MSEFISFIAEATLIGEDMVVCVGVGGGVEEGARWCLLVVVVVCFVPVLVLGVVIVCYEYKM